MNKRFSTYLDLLRFLAAMIVFVSHFAYTRFTDGHYLIIRELNLGSDAVVFFFVLSGLVISYTTDVKDKNLKQYSFHRFTRLYSVIIPALIFTIIADITGKNIAAQNYDGWWYHNAPLWEQAIQGLTLSSQWLYQNFRIGTNGPWWSLSYEAAYYILFGVLFYMNGAKKYLILIPLCFIFGFSVMLLFPIWLLGVWTYKQIKANALPQRYAWLCAIAPPLIYITFLWMKIPDTLLIITKLTLGETFVNETLAFSDEFVWNMIIAQLICFHLLGVSALSNINKNEVKENISKIIKWCAGATFTIYIIHYPALQLMNSIIPDTIHILLRHGLLFTSVLLICLLFAELSERRLKWLRCKLKTISQA